MNIRESYMRGNTLSAVLQYTAGASDQPVSLHAGEWWNGEGIDFQLECANKERLLSLHMDDLEAIMAVGLAMGLIDMEYVNEAVDRIKQSMRKP